MFFFPSGASVERQVLQGFAPGGAVRQSTCGKQDDVPVPRKISSTGSENAAEAESMEPMAAGGSCDGAAAPTATVSTYGAGGKRADHDLAATWEQY